MLSSLENFLKRQKKHTILNWFVNCFCFLYRDLHDWFNLTNWQHYCSIHWQHAVLIPYLLFNQLCLLWQYRLSSFQMGVQNWERFCLKINIRPISLHSIFEFWISEFISNSERNRVQNQLDFFFEFELDFYCLCSLQKSISKSNWF